MNRLFPLILTLTLFSVGSAFAQPQPDSAAIQARVEAQNAFRQLPEAGAWTIRRHEITQTPVSIFGGPSQAFQLRGTNPEARARGFFARHRQMFGYRPDGDELEVEYVRERRGFAYVQLNQRYKGISVHRGGYKVKMTQEGGLRMITGRFFPNINVAVTPGLSASRATEIAARATSSDSLMNEPESELVVYPGEGRYALAYKVHLAVVPAPQSWRVFVDAQTGNVLEKENVTMHLASTTTRGSSPSRPSPRSTVSPLTTTGSGEVYLDNPNDGSTVIKDLPRLSGSGSSLSGEYAEAHNYGRSNATPTSSPATYYFSPSNTHFDEVNLYYHVDRYADHLPSIGFAGLGRTIEAYAHYGNNYNNAFYDEPNNVGNGQQLYFGDGDGVIFRDFAKEDDIIYHEFNHAVLDHLDIGYNTYPDETGALQEGTADYLAASFANNPRIGQWVTACTNTGDLRTVSNSESTFRYGNKSSVEYAYCSKLNGGNGGHHNPDQTRYAISMIWSGALWDLRNVIGASTTDELVIETFNSLSNTPDFLQARDALIQADNDINGGANTCDIKNAFADRGIGEAIAVYLSGSAFLDSGEQGSWSANVNCSSSPYDWQYRSVGSFTWQDKNCTGTSCTHTFVNNSPVEQDGGIRIIATTGARADTVQMSVTVSPSCGENISICSSSNTDNLAATLRNLEAQSQSTKTAEVTWQVTAPPINSEFVVQHRADSIAQWSTLGTVPVSDSSSLDSSRAVAYRFRTEKLEIGSHKFRVGLPQDAGTGPRAVGTSVDDNPQRFTGPVTAKIKIDEAYRFSTYPNPVQQRVTVELAIQERQDVQVRLYDMLGRRVTTLRNGPMPAQELRRLRLDVSATGLTSGTYFLRVRGEDFAATEQITVVR